MKPDSQILMQTARVLFWPLVILSFVAYYRGHQLPGGGFIGGLLAAAAFVLIALGEGTAAGRKRLVLATPTWVAIGLLLAGSAALAGMFTRGVFFAPLWLEPIALPGLGSLHLGSPMLFDAGVYLVVVGFTSEALFRWLEESE
ncbi:MAG: MnhB domain-containing protein [Opitutaceae bacterium]|nr:MnhB domain-containing protein [Opitutaceae bacterium]